MVFAATASGRHRYSPSSYKLDLRQELQRGGRSASRRTSAARRTPPSPPRPRPTEPSRPSRIPTPACRTTSSMATSSVELPRPVEGSAIGELDQHLTRTSGKDHMHATSLPSELQLEVDRHQRVGQVQVRLDSAPRRPEADVQQKARTRSNSSTTTRTADNVYARALRLRGRHSQCSPGHQDRARHPVQGAVEARQPQQHVPRQDAGHDRARPATSSPSK